MSSAVRAVERAADIRTSPDAAQQRVRGRHRVSHQPSGASEPPAGDIAERVRAGDERALEALFRAHYAALCDFATRYVREEALAEELVQELFADLWAHRANWRLRGSVRAYLFSAVRNRALNLRKRQSVERDWERDEVVSEVPALHRVPAQADEALERDELRARVDAAVESLPERCRLVMHLRWREQMPHAEIAAVMGISVKGVEMQLTRGLKALRALLVR
jgi:RNA polymerase sigma-70 factor (ECF subfamily)